MSSRIKTRIAGGINTPAILSLKQARECYALLKNMERM